MPGCIAIMHGVGPSKPQMLESITFSTDPGSPPPPMHYPHTPHSLKLRQRPLADGCKHPSERPLCNTNRIMAGPAESHTCGAAGASGFVD